MEGIKTTYCMTAVSA